MKQDADTTKNASIVLLRRLLKKGTHLPLPFPQFWSYLHQKMPKRLFLRSLLILAIPMILLQSVVAFVFMERHWQTVTKRLSAAVTRDIAALVDSIETFTHDDDYENLKRIARERMNLQLSVLPEGALPLATPKPFFSLLETTLSREISEQIGHPFWLDTVGDSKVLEIRISLDTAQVRVIVPRHQAYVSNSHIFLIWMVGTSLVLLGIAAIFLRNQIRPIQELASAAESFGKGRPATCVFKPKGAAEVRQAGQAFLEMKQRIERHIEQRTIMLAGISHDLRTALTRLNLDLALLAGDDLNVKGMQRDVNEMQQMVEEYLAFARSAEGEESGRCEIQPFLKRLIAPFDADVDIDLDISGVPEAYLRVGAFGRCVTNIIQNACRFSQQRIKIRAHNANHTLTLVIEDDGPGLAETEYENVFKPFYTSPPTQSPGHSALKPRGSHSGSGLGLAIARDIVRAHGGDITPSPSSLGGLKLSIVLPV